MLFISSILHIEMSIIDPGGLMVIILTTGSEVRGFKPSWGQLIFFKEKFISCVVLGTSQWFFHFGNEIVIA